MKMSRLLIGIDDRDLNLLADPTSRTKSLGCSVCMRVKPHSVDCRVRVRANVVSSVDTRYIVGSSLLLPVALDALPL